MAETFEIDFADGISDPAGAASGSLGKLVGSMQGALGEMGPLAGAVGLLGGALLAGAAAMGAIAIKGAAMALSATEAKGKLLATFSALAGGPKEGQATLDMLDQLGAQFNLTREQLGPLASKLLAAGVPLDKLHDSLVAVSGAEAMMGGAGEKVTSLLAKLNEQGMKGTKLKISMGMLVGTGVTEAELMKQLGMTPKMFDLAKKQGTITGAQLSDAIVKVLAAKGKGPLEEQALTLTSIWGKFQENITKLFEGVDVKPFLKGLQDVLSVFDQSTESGKTLKTMVTGALNAIFSAATKALPYVKVGLMAIIYYGYKVYVALKPAIASIKESFSKLMSGAGGGKGALNLFIGALSRGAGMMISFGTWVARVVKAIADLIGWFQKGKEAASNLIKGLTSGITGGTGSVVGAIKGMASSAISALKGALKISSPSKVMLEMGVHTAKGMAQGLDVARPQVKAAGTRMAAAAVAAPPARAGASSGGKGGATIRVDVGGIHIEGAAGESALTLTEEAVSTLFERLALQQGLGTA